MTRVRYEVDGWGVGELWTKEGRVVWHEHPRPVRVDVSLPVRSHPHPSKGGGRFPSPPSTATLARKGARDRDNFGPIVVERVRGFFAGAVDDFADIPLDLDGLTPFGRDLARALRAVPRGEVVTYSELAALAGRPRAARAAGTFCAQNRLAIFVPCHRVVGATGLGGYGDLGLDYKRRLLALEDVSL
ncbi:MAG: methylated-DNA--[protein]-cysteine S-methyltransferase [Gaiellaceae bacterium]